MGEGRTSVLFVKNGELTTVARATPSLRPSPCVWEQYAVVKGVKEWTLLPPFARALLEEKTYVAARWRCNDEGSWSGPWSLQVDEAEKQEHKLTRWITEPKDMKAGREKAALTGLTTVLRLEAGEVLYLPPLWYHAVQTRGDEIAVAVNWMLDMRFDDRFCFHKLVETT